MEISNGLVVLMGLGVVFAGLISIIILCWIMGLFLKGKPSSEKSDKAENSNEAEISTQIPDKQKFVAAVSAVIAEELGTDVSAIRINSIKKV